MSNRIQPKEQGVILDSISEGVFTVDLYWRITSFNRAAEEIIGIVHDKVLGQRWGMHLCQPIWITHLKQGIISVTTNESRQIYWVIV